MRQGISFAEVVHSPPSTEPLPLSPPASLKRRHFLDYADNCSKCSCSGHKGEECWHQLTCKRWSGVGHFAIRYSLRTTPHRLDFKKARVRSKHPLQGASSDHNLEGISSEVNPLLRIPVRSHPISLSVFTHHWSHLEIKGRPEKMVVIKVLSDNASTRTLHLSFSHYLNTDLCEHITPFKNDFILKMASVRDATMVVKRSRSLLTHLSDPTTSPSLTGLLNLDPMQ